jgi:hypothetical protein
MLALLYPRSYSDYPICYNCHICPLGICGAVNNGLKMTHPNGLKVTHQ